MTNKIEINKNTIIQLSDGNYVVKYRVKNTSERAKNEYRWEVGGYFTCLEDALTDILDNAPFKVSASLGKTLVEYIDFLDKMKKDIIKSIKKYEQKRKA